MDNQKIVPEPMHILAKLLGEIVCTDIYGPLSRCPRGNIALFVALNILPGFVIVSANKSMKADSFVTTMRKIVQKLKSLEMSIQKVLSDIARQFRSRKFFNYCSFEGI